MSLISWSNDLSVGIASIDAQHRKLVELINDLHEAMRKGEGKSNVGAVVQELAHYAATHFAHEERLMRVHRWAGLDAHIAQHKEFVEKVGAMQRELARPTAVLAIEVQDFLRHWLLQHILETDKRYGTHLRAAGAT